MNEVHAIKNLDDVNLIITLLQKWGNHREAMLVKLGCNVALRITDLLNLRFADVNEGKVSLQEGKTGKDRQITLNQPALEAISVLHAANPGHQYLFQATGNHVGQAVKPISRQYVHTILKEAQKSLKLNFKLGTHSLRKTFGYHAYQNGIDIHVIQKLLNHSSAKTTLAYIGITDETVQDVYSLISIG